MREGVRSAHPAHVCQARAQLNEHGNAVGVVVGAFAEGNDVNFCIPVTFISTIVDFKESYPMQLNTLEILSSKEEKGQQKKQEAKPNYEKEKKTKSCDGLICKIYCANGTEKYNNENYEEAIDDFKKAIDACSFDACGYYGLGLVYQKQGKTLSSFFYLQKAYEIDPGLREK